MARGVEWRFIGRTFLASSSNAGIQFMNSIQFALAGPLFQSQFKLSTPIVTLIMALTVSTSFVVCNVAFSKLFLFSRLKGPLSGILLQPLVGGLSDRHRSAWGKRRPFIAFGSVRGALQSSLCVFD
jgi:Na+/melibiose symporter-like transporter